MLSHPFEQICHARRGIQTDISWILDLQTRVQEALRRSGSLQELSLGSNATLETSVKGGELWVFEIESWAEGDRIAEMRRNEREPVGAVMISRFGEEGYGSWSWLEGSEFGHVDGGGGGDFNHEVEPGQSKVQKAMVEKYGNGIWYLHSLMLNPEFQGQGLGRVFLRQLLSILELETNARDKSKEEVKGVSIVLDCWAGNDKLRAFYEAVGFKLLGLFPEEDYEIAVFAWEVS
jgi:GNAT superfamily N-acetyltransferase